MNFWNLSDSGMFEVPETLRLKDSRTPDLKIPEPRKKEFKSLKNSRTRNLKDSRTKNLKDSRTNILAVPKFISFWISLDP